MPPSEFGKLTEAIQTRTLQFNLDYWPDKTLLDGWTVKTDVRIRERMEDDVLEACQRVHRAALSIEQTMEAELAKQRPAAK